MASFKDIIEKINRNVIVRNVILAVCGILVFFFLVTILLNLFTRHNKSVEVPDFSAMSMEDARKAARKGSFRIEVNDSLFVPAYEGGVVLDQLPKPGTRVKSGRRVFVTVNSYRQKMVEIPYVTGYSLRQAKNILEVAGLEIEKLIFRQDIATNNVLEEQYNGKVIGRSSKVEAEVGSGVTLIVGMSGEERPPQTPKLVGFPLHQAKSRIWEAGLNVGKIEFDENITLMNRNEAKVWMQVPEQGVRTHFGTAVNIKLTLDQDKVEKGSSSSDRAARRTLSLEQAREKENESQGQ